jgi:Fe-coproporphyrin III synthase
MVSAATVARRRLTLATHKIHTLPVVVLMPHSACNCRCVMCDIWLANRTKREISREDLEAQLPTFDKFRVERVVLSGGEALMHSNLWTLCDLLKERGCKITILSTGLLLAKHAEGVVKWADDVIVSLDGSREIHDAIRRIPRAYERLAAGVAALRALSPQIRVTGRCVVQRRNFADLPNIVDSARAIGLNQISFLAADVASTAFNRPTPWGDERVSDVALSGKETDELREVLEDMTARYADDFAAGFIAEKPGKLRQIYEYFAALNGVGEMPERRCNAPWVSTVVEADGTVRPCFFHAPLGNIHSAPLDAILNSPTAIDFRRNLDVRKDPICRRCVCTLHVAPRSAV